MATDEIPAGPLESARRAGNLSDNTDSGGGGGGDDDGGDSDTNTADDTPAGPIESARRAGNLPDDDTGSGGDGGGSDSDPPAGPMESAERAGTTGNERPDVGTEADTPEGPIESAREAGTLGNERPDVGTEADTPAGPIESAREAGTLENERPDVDQPPTAGDVARSLGEDPDRSLRRGGTTNEFVRNVAAFGLDVAFQNPEELGTGIAIEERTGGVELSGPSLSFRTDADALGGVQIFESGPRGEFNRDIADSLTEGRGLFSDETEQEFRKRARRNQEFYGVGEEVASVTPEIEIFDGVTTKDVARGVGNVPGEAVAGVDTALLTADLATEAATNAPRTVDEFGARETLLTGLEAGGRTTEAAIETAEERPGETAGAIVGGVGASIVGGKLLGAGLRRGRDRLRTAGGTEVDLDDLTTKEAAEFTRTGGQRGERFPSADEPDLFESDPPEAVRRQARRDTPPEIEQRFEEAGVDEGVTLKKALETEPEGPSRAKRAGGFQTQEGSFESPGGFVGPSLSPNFLRLGGGRSRFSLKPGLPDLGGKPTAALVRTDVDAPDADTLGDFNRELLESAGETTARTKPASAVNVGEIEAVIPPEAKFADIGGSRSRGILRRAGIGSDFYTTVEGRRVPLRPVAPADAVGAPSRRTVSDFLADERAQAGGAGTATQRTFTLSELERPAGQAVDRPLPLPLTGAGTSTATNATATASPTPVPRTGSEVSTPVTDVSTSPSTPSPGAEGTTSTVSAPSQGSSGGTSPANTPSEPSPGGSGASGASSTPSAAPSSPGTSAPAPSQRTPAPSGPGTPATTPPSSAPSTPPPSRPSDLPGRPPASPLGGSPAPPSPPTKTPRRFGFDREESPIEAVDAEEETAVERFQYDIASPEEVLAGEDDLALDDVDAL